MPYITPPVIPLLDSGIQSVKNLDPVVKPRDDKAAPRGAKANMFFSGLTREIHGNNGSSARCKMTTAKIAAFTLVEMSIVLIIIGLIVAGIAKGQSMIHSAKVMSVVSFIEQKKVAIRTFEMKYDALPGDMNNATDYWPSGAGTNGTVTSGNGDFKIAWWPTEAHMTWKHLQLAKMIDENLTGLIGSQTHEPGVNIPEISLEGVGISLYWTTINGNGTSLVGAGTTNRFLLGKAHPTGTTNSNYGAALAPQDAHSIDKKMDDGSARGGKVIGTRGMNPSGSWVTCYSGTEYILSATDLRCIMTFDLD